MEVRSQLHTLWMGGPRIRCGCRRAYNPDSPACTFPLYWTHAKNYSPVRFGVPIAVSMECSSNMTPYSLVNSYRSFVATYGFHLRSWLETAYSSETSVNTSLHAPILPFPLSLSSLSSRANSDWIPRYCSLYLVWTGAATAVFATSLRQDTFGHLS
jgi:hypothetical protein